jgi:2'-5' RNA ligase
VSGKVVRLFVAIELPGELLRALNGAQHALQREPALARLRWVRPEGIHLTLKFLGETSEGKLGGIEAAMARAVKGTAPFGLRLGKPGTFGGRGSPRVAWVDVEGEVESLAGLQARVEDELEGCGFAREKQTFSPHLTLARVPPERSREVAEPLASAIKSISIPAVTFTAEKISLMKSDLKPAGAVYTRLIEAPFR